MRQQQASTETSLPTPEEMALDIAREGIRVDEWHIGAIAANLRYDEDQELTLAEAERIYEEALPGMARKLVSAVKQHFERKEKTDASDND